MLPMPLILVHQATAKLPYDPLTDHMSHDCWVPDYCEPERFQYKLCKLRLRGRGSSQEYTCGEGEYCEELDCLHKCWLPSACECHATGPHEGRMICADGGCFKHPSTQWGICRPVASESELAQTADAEDEDALLPTGFHFWTEDELLYNAKLHIDEGHHYARPRVPRPPKEEL